MVGVFCYCGVAPVEPQGEPASKPTKLEVPIQPGEFQQEDGTRFKPMASAGEAPTREQFEKAAIEVATREARIVLLEQELERRDPAREAAVKLLVERADTAEARTERLTQALREYGGHKVWEGVAVCAAIDGQPCNCGFDAALADAPPESPEHGG